MTMQAQKLEELQEELEMIQDVDDLLREDFATAGGNLTDPGGGLRNISDPTRLVRIYVTATGEPRDVPIWTLQGKNSILLRRDTDPLSPSFSKRVFSTKPTEPWELGKVPCMLNQSHPNRAKYNQIGLAGRFCPAAHLASIYSQRYHMEHKHKTEWATIRAFEAEEQAEEERVFRRLQTEMLVAQRAAMTPREGTRRANEPANDSDHPPARRAAAGTRPAPEPLQDRQDSTGQDHLAHDNER